MGRVVGNWDSLGRAANASGGVVVGGLYLGGAWRAETHKVDGACLSFAALLLEVPERACAYVMMAGR